MPIPNIKGSAIHNVHSLFNLSIGIYFETLLKPNSKDVVLIALSARRFAVIRFSGLAEDKNIKVHTDKLEAYIATEKMKSIGGAVVVFYNRPWTIPFLRRNEVIVEVESTIDSKFIKTHS